MTINTNYTNYKTLGLSYLLKSSTDSSSSDDGTDLYNLLKNGSGMRSYNLSKNGSNSTFIATTSMLSKATTPGAKITLSQSLGQAVLAQADAMVKTGNATRVSAVVTQATQVLNAVSTSVTSLAKSDSSGKTLSKYKSTISDTMDAINTALSEVKGVLKKASAADQKSVTSSLATLDALGAKVAKTMNLSWDSVTGTAANNVKSSSSTLSHTSSTKKSLVDLLA